MEPNSKRPAGDDSARAQAFLPKTCLPAWDVADLPEPQPIRRRSPWAFIGPGIVMMGAQIAGGEWLMGPEMTARYGGNLMWIATIAIAVQVFYNLECGRYALYCGEPIFTGFFRTRPGPAFWASVFIFLSLGAIIPGMAYHGGSVFTAMIKGSAPLEEDRGMVLGFGFLCLVLVTVPVFFGGKIYNTIQTVMAIKVFVVLSFTLVVGVLFVSGENWLNVFSGFLKFGSVPVSDGEGGEKIVNVFTQLFNEGTFPAISLTYIAVVGAFAGFAGGGGLGNSLYSNYVRDKGWGMGSRVGAIPSAVGKDKTIRLSHLGTVFPVDSKNLARWREWWKYILSDQVLIWAPGCFLGMALPALLSIEFAPHSEIYANLDQYSKWSQAVITADGLRSAPQFGPTLQGVLWFVTLFVGLIVLLPSQMSVVEDVSRRWTDVIWSTNSRVRETMKPTQVKKVYYTLLLCYFAWCCLALFYFGLRKENPRLMTLIIANLGNLAMGLTAVFILYVNLKYLPKAIRPGLLNRLGLVCCAVFYLGLAVLVFVNTQVPILRDLLGL
jgi:hypothetical protein